MRPVAFAILLSLLVGVPALGAPALVATVDVESAPFEVTLPEKVGLLEAGEEVEVSFQVSGRVDRRVDTSVRVAAGAVLAALDSRLEAALLRQAELRLRDARADHRRLRGLHASNAASQKVLDSAEILVELRIAEVDAAREQLERRTLVAPFDGIVAQTRIEVGEVVSPGAPVALFIDISSLRLRVGVPGYQIAQVAPGAKALVTVPAGEEGELAGVVELVAPAAAPGRHLFEVEIRIENPDEQLRPGMGARANIVVETLGEAAVVPVGSVVERDGERVVFFVADGRAHAVAIHDAVLQGERLVLRHPPRFKQLAVRGQRDLRDGMSVRVDNSVLEGAAR